MIFATQCARLVSRESAKTAGASALMASAATALTARSPSQSAVAGARTCRKKATRSGVFSGTLSVPWDTTAPDAVCAHPTALKAWSTKVNSARRLTTRDRTLTLWSALMAKSRKDSYATILAAPVRVARTTFAGDNVRLVRNSVVFSA